MTRRGHEPFISSQSASLSLSLGLSNHFLPPAVSQHTHALNMYIQSQRFPFTIIVLHVPTCSTHVERESRVCRKKKRGKKSENESCVPAVRSILLNQLQNGLRVNAFNFTGHVHCGTGRLHLFHCERRGWHCNQIIGRIYELNQSKKGAVMGAHKVKRTRLIRTKYTPTTKKKETHKKGNVASWGRSLAHNRLKSLYLFDSFLFCSDVLSVVCMLFLDASETGDRHAPCLGRPL